MRRRDGRQRRNDAIWYSRNVTATCPIQSAWNITDNEKREQETFSLRHIGDNFRKVVVTGNPYENPWTDRSGVTFIGIMPFLLDPRSLETL